MLMSHAVRVPSVPPHAENGILAALPANERDRLLSHARHVDFAPGEALLRHDQTIGSVNFIISGLASAVITTQEGKTVAVGLIGREGVVGITGVLGDLRSHHSCYMQVGGSAWRVPTAQARSLMQQPTRLQALLHRYLLARFRELSQSTACHLTHTLEQRLARWLLTASGRAGSEELSLTHEYLAQMLGAQRSTISLAAGNLERLRLVSYKRGHLTVLDSRGLERAACECYSIVQHTFAQITPR